MKTKTIVRKNNLNLLKKIMEKDEPVLCDSFSDAKDENFDKPLKDVGL